MKNVKFYNYNIYYEPNMVHTINEQKKLLVISIIKDDVNDDTGIAAMLTYENDSITFNGGYYSKYIIRPNEITIMNKSV